MRALVVVVDILLRLLRARRGCSVVLVVVLADMRLAEHMRVLQGERRRGSLQMAQEAVDRKATVPETPQMKMCSQIADSPNLAAVSERLPWPRLVVSRQELQASS